MKPIDFIIRASASRRKTSLAILFVLLGTLFGTSEAAEVSGTPPSESPSFSCKAPNNVEAVICGDRELAARDRTMAVLYEAARFGALGLGASQQQTRQRQWLKSRNGECSGQDIHTCLVNSYDARLNELAVAALFQTPDAALAELARQASKTAPLYEAIYRYGTLDDQSERTNVVAQLIKPTFKEIHGESWFSNFTDAASAEAAASSDHQFARFLNAASNGGYSMTLPCAAIVRRAGLISGLDSIFAGTADSFLMHSDCDATLPATPILDQLAKAAEAVQPECKGTIRFTLWRDYQQTLVAIHLRRFDLFNEAQQQVTQQQFRAEHRALIHDATTELRKYYSAYFAASPTEAEEQSNGGVNTAISGAFNLCEID